MAPTYNRRCFDLVFRENWVKKKTDSTHEEYLSLIYTYNHDTNKMRAFFYFMLKFIEYLAVLRP